MCPDTPPSPQADPTVWPFWDGSYINKPVTLSYAYMGSVITIQAGGIDHNTGLNASGYALLGNASGASLASFDMPADTIAFIENWINGGPNGFGVTSFGNLYGNPGVGTFAWVENCGLWILAGRVFPSPNPGSASNINNFPHATRRLPMTASPARRRVRATTTRSTTFWSMVMQSCCGMRRSVATISGCSNALSRHRRSFHRATLLIGYTEFKSGELR